MFSVACGPQLGDRAELEWIQRRASGLNCAKRLREPGSRSRGKTQRLEKVAPLRVFQEVPITDQLGHYIRRAREERVLAARAASSEGELAHRQLARQYESLISELNASALTEPTPEADHARFPISGAGMLYGFAHRAGQSLRPTGLPRLQH